VPAEGEAEQVDLLQPEGVVDEAEGVAGHVGHVVRDDTGRAADPAVVDRDDLAILGEALEEGKIPAVEVAPGSAAASGRARVSALTKRR
jgi:hypothetical protein